MRLRYLIAGFVGILFLGLLVYSYNQKPLPQIAVSVKGVETASINDSFLIMKTVDEKKVCLYVSSSKNDNLTCIVEMAVQDFLRDGMTLESREGDWSFKYEGVNDTSSLKKGEAIIVRQFVRFTSP